MSLSRFNCCLVAFALFLAGTSSPGQTVNDGAGSYSTLLPSGGVGPHDVAGQDILPKVSQQSTWI